MSRRYRVLIGGEWVGDDLPGIEVTNPYDGAVIGIVPETSPDMVEQAVKAAQRGFK